MELKDFIKETLIQITNGVAEAQKAVKDTGCLINPAGYNNQRYIEEGDNSNMRGVQKITMSIAITVTEGNENKAGLGVVSGFFTAGTATKSNDVSSTVNRIEFDIPISLPVMTYERK